MPFWEAQDGDHHFLQISMNFRDSYEQVVDGVDTLPSPGGLGVQQWTKAVVTAAITCKKSPRYFFICDGQIYWPWWPWLSKSAPKWSPLILVNLRILMDPISVPREHPQPARSEELLSELKANSLNEELDLARVAGVRWKGTTLICTPKNEKTSNLPPTWTSGWIYWIC